MNRSTWVETSAYLLVADDTPYRFSISRCPSDPHDAAILATGLGNNPLFEYVFITINMPHGTGYECVPVKVLEQDKTLYDFAQMTRSRGFRQLDEYTILAVLLAVKSLTGTDKYDLDRAARAMGQVPGLRLIYART